ncbi:MAG: lysophospholipid acyltransferase family protein [Acidobacteria bacterium]|nr:lysophospholipid acyltransferase family protein [Acidobacteriota bacterium]
MPFSLFGAGQNEPMSKKSNFQVWLEYFLARCIFGFLGLLPRSVAVFLGIAISGLGFRLLGGLRRAALKNLEIAFPEKSETERLKIARGTFENLGRVLGEASQLPKSSVEDIAAITEFEFDDEIDDLYRRVKADKQGVLIVTAHMGNWELFVLAFAALHEPISYLARPIDNARIEEMVTAFRTRFGNRPINKSGSAITAISHLREGGILGILADVNAHPKEGVFVPFFGVDACTPSGPAMIALRSGAVILPAVCVWDAERKKFRFVRGKLIQPADTGDRKADIITTTAEYTAELEKLIRQYPDQWMWIHKRWKTRPKGEPGLY